MKQFQFQYEDPNGLRRELRKIGLWRNEHITSGIVFQILSESTDTAMLDEICRIISETIPDALYYGCSTNGNICDGHISESEVVIVCTIYEYPSTRCEILQYRLTDETSDETVGDLLEKLNSRPWVRSIELLVTIRGMSMTRFCEDLQDARPDIAIFGGGAFASDLNNNYAIVFSKDHPYQSNGVVFLLTGGEDYFVSTSHIAGWKPLAKPFQVTKASGSTLYELDGKPAYDVYYRYLNIRNDENFFTNSLEFPFFYEHNGIKLLRAPVSSNPDGSLTMTADIEEDVVANLAYGDPQTILDEISHRGRQIRDFCPEAIHIYSCAARRTFWGVNEISKESMPFQSIAPTTGFYTSGEFLRTNGKMNQHNVTLVVAAMREGEPAENERRSFDMEENIYAGRVSMINRLATFIDAATHELEDANARLSEMAVTDGMTQLCNRAEIQRRITERLYSGETLCLLMLDIDNFKHVNDTFGHKSGDNVIKGLAELLREAIKRCSMGASAGRWGGEEFMLLLPCALERAEQGAAQLLTGFSDITFPAAGHQTVSIGVTQAIPGENLDALLVRVDKALYQAKKTGKNRYVIL